MSEGAALGKLGLRAGQVVGQTVFELYRDNPDILESAKRALAGQSQVTENQAECRIFETHWIPIEDEQHGGVEQILGVAVDITERELAKQELHTLNAELEQRVHKRTRQVREQAAILETPPVHPPDPHQILRRGWMATKRLQG